MLLGQAFRTRVYRVSRSNLRKDVAQFPRTPTVSVLRGPPVIRSILLRCGLFSFVSVNVVFVGSIIWSYENWRKSSNLPSKQKFGGRLRQIFQSLVGRPPRSTDLFWGRFIRLSFICSSLGIALVNFLVFLGNNSRRGPMLLKFFSNSPYGRICASLLSILSKAARRSPVPSIGASGAICAVLGAFCMLEPHAQLCIPFLVNIVPHSFSAGSAGWAILAFEFFGAMLLSARSPIDHAAHLGGLMFGMYVPPTLLD
ncbi:unnamed protein product [Dibothriocephalus latus]|uniref:rhomboid protease n=1 Tax=Dibothriocephalus latus TaxID=60516 RepID=A0A3P7L1L3_DIBLA|nr:unnamed protein product [Dibothriocephalus latus]